MRSLAFALLLLPMCLGAAGDLREGGPARSSPAAPASAAPRRLKGGHGNHVASVIIGLILWCCVPGFLWNNEKIAVKQAKLQGKAKNHAVVIHDVYREPLPELDGHIVFMSDESTCQEQLQDAYFPDVKVSNCVKLRRVVEMMQWQECTSEKQVHTHSLVWSDKPESCPHDPKGHDNPQMPIPSSQRSLHDYRVSDAIGDGNGEKCAEACTYAVQLGHYYLGVFVRRELDNWQELMVDEQQLGSCKQLIAKGRPQRNGQWWMFGSAGQLGDVRVRFEALHCGPISLCGVLAHVAEGRHTLVPVIHEDGFRENCAQEFCMPSCGEGDRLEFGEPQHDDELLEGLEDQEPELDKRERERFLTEKTAYDQTFYQVDHGSLGLCCMCCGSEDVSKGMHFCGLEEEFLGVAEHHCDLDELMDDEAQAANRRHNCARLCGILVGILASWLIIDPLVSALNYNWFISMMGGGALSCLICCGACTLSTVTALVTIALAWFAARPRLSIVLLLLVGLVVGGFTFFAYAGHNANAPP